MRIILTEEQFKSIVREGIQSFSTMGGRGAGGNFLKKFTDLALMSEKVKSLTDGTKSIMSQTAYNAMFLGIQSKDFFRHMFLSNPEIMEAVAGKKDFAEIGNDELVDTVLDDVSDDVTLVDMMDILTGYMKGSRAQKFPKFVINDVILETPEYFFDEKAMEYAKSFMGLPVRVSPDNWCHQILVDSAKKEMRVNADIRDARKDNRLSDNEKIIKSRTEAKDDRYSVRFNEMKSLIRTAIENGSVTREDAVKVYNIVNAFNKHAKCECAGFDGYYVYLRPVKNPKWKDGKYTYDDATRERIISFRQLLRKYGFSPSTPDLDSRDKTTSLIYMSIN